jgi:hypothetical protein
MYFCNVRANDTAGNTSSVVSSNGQLVAPSVTFAIGSNSIAFANLNAGDSYTDSKSTTLTTSTNAYGGYIVRAFMPASLTYGSKTIPAFNGGTYASPDSWQSGDTGLGYTTVDTSVQGSNIFQAATCPGGSTLSSPGCFAPFATSGPGDIIADHTSNVTGSSISNEVFTLTLKLKVTNLQAAGRYTSSFVVGVTPTY